MRLIKFRAKKDDISDSSFVYGMLVYNEQGDPRILTNVKRSLFTTCIKGTEGQFTGLKDKIGEEIYEGDIIRENYSDGSGHRDFIVEWKDEEVVIGESCGERNIYCRWVGIHFRTLYSKDYEQIDDIGSMEVKGNICENPEKVKDETKH